MRFATLRLALLAVLPACSVTQDLDTASQAAAAKASLDSLWVRFADAADRRDREGFGSLFADDGVLVSSGAPTVRGRMAIQEHLASRYSGVDITALRITPEDLKASGSLAIQGGSYEEDFTEAGAEKTGTGRYAVVVERGGDGPWRIRRLVTLADSVRGR